ncbi:hypothetical protein GM921_09835 [Pedobacter sp. LMG 31464]|uniref:DUF5977 domain-containing protein n=1 Tax=Pedobacter planticolens TaxID=2679964 RepID=A0A923DXE3_9SPHI|nr:DUF5977 domain-containing protein [Pedobacter planticolens]MBB2145787.1 hypothetical protein [Pedobacter planticolens]
MKNLILLFCCCCITAICFGQSMKLDGPYLQSPNAASMGIYGKVDVSSFTGIPNIRIPVLSLTQGDIPITAELRYMAGGVKPEEHPSWVGQNWTLSVGGVVTRKRNGGVDEVRVDNFTNQNIFAYYFNYGGLNTTAWNTPTFMNNYLGNDVSNGLFTQLSPDEFMFTLPNGKSGSFFKNDQGTWSVKGNQPGLMKINVSLSPTSPLLILNSVVKPVNYQEINQIIYKIEITDDEGYVFTFGGDIDAIEFIRERLSAGLAQNNVIANAWNLVKITSPKGNEVNFSYERGPHQFIQNVSYGHTLSYNINGATCSGYVINPLQYSGYVITPTYLKEITSGSFKVSFEKQVSNELKYPYGLPQPQPSANAFNGFAYGDFSDAHYGPGVYTNGQQLLDVNPHTDYKLKTITIADGNDLIKERYAFTYNNDTQSLPNERLFLESFRRTTPLVLIDDQEPSTDIAYKFKYNDKHLLPAYNSLMVDQWGYYNGKPYPITNLSVNLATLNAQLAADFDYAKLGSLSEITYPTGGKSTFEYELNDYSAYIKKAPNTLSLVSGSGTGGGLRIKKISNYSEDGVFTFKQYVYNSEATGVSSGILAGLKQIYYKAQIGQPGGNIAYAEYVSNNSISDLNYTNGRDVVYSEVKEINEDGSWTIYKYSNSDNVDYRDEVPNYIFTQGIGVNSSAEYGTYSFTFDPSYTYPLISHTSRELERGQLLSKEIHAADGKLVYKEVNQYRDDAGRYNEYVKSFNYAGQQISCSLGFLYERYVEPVKIYTFFPYLKTQTIYNYDLNENITTTLVKQNVYDNNYKVLKEDSYINSKGETNKTEYKYPFDFGSNTVLQGMLAKNIMSKVVERTNYTNSTSIQTERVNFSLQNTSMYLPVSTEVQVGTNTPSVTAYEHDNHGNLASLQTQGGTKTSYVWSYQQQYPIVKAINAAKEELFAENFENTGASGVTTGLAHTGQKFWLGSVYSLSWSLPNAKSYVYSYWYRSNGKWYYKDPLAFTGAASLTNGDAYDDILVYPADALVSSYTYDPLVGKTSEIDAKGQTSYYTYDDMNRLLTIKDQTGAIIKYYRYNYKQPFVNEVQSQAFTKNNCTSGQGSTVNYVVPAGAFTSLESVAAANALALASIAANGQNYANTNGICQNIYVKKVITGTGSAIIGGYQHDYVEYSAFFYSDEACTQPYTLTSPLTVRFAETGLTTYANGNPSLPFYHEYPAYVSSGVSSTQLMSAWSYCEGGLILIEKSKTTQKGLPPPPDDPGYCYSSSVSLVNGTGYIVKAY